MTGSVLRKSLSGWLSTRTRCFAGLPAAIFRRSSTVRLSAYGRRLFSSSSWSTRPSEYAQGGFIGSRDDDIPIPLSCGHALISYDSYRALSPELRAHLSRDAEIVYSAENVREFGMELLDELNRADYDPRHA